MKTLTVQELAERLGGEIAVDAGNRGGRIDGFYAGDFLSNVMGHAQENCAWFTVMTNVNVAGVASLAGVACVVICEGNRPDAVLTDRAQEKGVTLILTDKPVYEACVATVSD